MSETEQLFVITGGPGSGKTALVAALQAEGFACLPEAGRAVIQKQVIRKGTALPWADRLAFAEEMFRRDLQSWHDAQTLPPPVFFDRGLPDTVGYLKLIGLAVPPQMEEAVHHYRYQRHVFIAPPWPAIFGQDAERKQSWQEAEATYRSMVDVYEELGYELVQLPQISVAERMRFVVDFVR